MPVSRSWDFPIIQIVGASPLQRESLPMKLPNILVSVAFMLAAPVHAAQPLGDEPIAVPKVIKQGIDFVYVDPQVSSAARHQRPHNWLQRIFSSNREQGGPNPLFQQLADGLDRYRATWGSLPTVRIPAGPPLKLGASGTRVRLLRQRVGLPDSATYDRNLADAVSRFQYVHGIAPDGMAGRATVAALNLGPEPFEQRIAINMERAWRLPATGKFDRYVIVDAGSAQAMLIARDKVADSMRVVVGSPKTPTPMMAVLLRRARSNPYWNVPPELIRSLTAKRVLQQGPAYIANFHYEILSDWSATAQSLDPRAINWKAVAAGKSEIRVRQLPGPWNSMGAMKFEMPNDFGIYLHDTPHKELFSQDNRWLSNGCVRLQDYRRFADWVFREPPGPGTATEETFELARPVPVLMTYLTVAPGEGSVVFRPDPYHLDAKALPQMFGHVAVRDAALEGRH